MFTISNWIHVEDDSEKEVSTETYILKSTIPLPCYLQDNKSKFRVKNNILQNNPKCQQTEKQMNSLEQ